MNKVALIKENGEVATVCSTQLDNMYIDGEMYGDLMAKQLPLDADNQEFIQLKFWNFESGQWMARTERTGGYMVWSNNNWVLDNSELVLEIRQYRDSYLFSSDWTQFPDSPLTTAKKAEWVTYRQALRDVPEDYSDATSLDDVVWPTKP
tara:strand:+ start:133 stop:579 length:447 start_codon:yes stop_codon:yes gene_type:complete